MNGQCQLYIAFGVMQKCASVCSWHPLSTPPYPLNPPAIPCSARAPRVPCQYCSGLSWPRLTGVVSTEIADSRRQQGCASWGSEGQPHSFSRHPVCRHWGPLGQAGWQLHSAPPGRIPGTVSCPQLDRGFSPQGTACGNNVRSVADNSYPWDCLSLPPEALFVLNRMK